ncbi:MAG: hypothetical protein QG610_1252 [Euryarchaeota archaeon]|nr:hypothetical protein [Euryarchaeota archaeon]
MSTGKIAQITNIFLYSKSDLFLMPDSWSLSHTLGTRKKTFSWRIDSRGNIFIKRKFRKPLFPRIDKISCNHLDKLHEFMQDREWKDLANDAEKLYMGTEKDGIGKFLYRLRQEVPYAQLSSQLAAIFYHSEVWEWNEQKRGMKFLLLSVGWQEKTTQYYRNLLGSENEGSFVTEFSETSQQREEEQKEFQVALQETRKEEPVQKIEQTKLSAFFGF